MIELSVIIPYRREPLLGDVIQRLLDEARDASGIEVIVVGAGDWRDLPDDPRVRVIELERSLWPGPARNRGLAKASGDVVVFLDADCLPLPGWYASIRGSQTRGAVVCSGAIATPTDDFLQACYNLSGFREHLDGNPASARRFLASYCLWGPRRAFAGVGGFDETWQTAEDLDLTVRLSRAGWPLLFEPACRVLHRPTCRSLGQLVRRGWVHGSSSRRARQCYPDAFQVGSWTMSPLALVLLGPFVAGYFLFRTFRDQPRLRRICWRAAPAIFLYRLAWCLGAAWKTVVSRADLTTAASR